MGKTETPRGSGPGRAGYRDASVAAGGPGSERVATSGVPMPYDAQSVTSRRRNNRPVAGSDWTGWGDHGPG